MSLKPKGTRKNTAPEQRGGTEQKGKMKPPKKGRGKNAAPEQKGGLQEKKDRMKPPKKGRDKNAAPEPKGGGVRIHEATLYKGELKTPPPSTREGGSRKKRKNEATPEKATPRPVLCARGGCG